MSGLKLLAVPLAAGGVGAAAWALRALIRRKSATERIADRLSNVHTPKLLDASGILDRMPEMPEVPKVRLPRPRLPSLTLPSLRLPHLRKPRRPDVHPPTLPDLTPARKATARGTAYAVDAAQTAGLKTGRFLRARAKDVGDLSAPRHQSSTQILLDAATDAASSTIRRHPETLLLAAAGPAAAVVLARLRARHRLPIQCSVDVAAPLEVVYDEWTRLEFLPEGAHDVEQIERLDDGRLCGQINAGLRHIDWEAEVLDDRDCESFAWRSTAGSDCAGLITFHQLSDRLTRLELQLDVMPVNVSDTMALALQIADHRAQAELRRFKSRLETISPDMYDQLEDSDHTDQDEEER